MKRNPQLAKFKFYSKLNVSKEIKKAIRLFYQWKRLNAKEIRK